MPTESESVLEAVAAHLASGAVTIARSVWDAAHTAGDPLASDLVLAEIEERSGDQLWFADRPGSAAHYRLAQDILLPRAVQFDAGEEAEQRQQAWTRISNKLHYGTGSNGCRRANAVGTAHPNGCPPLPPEATALPVSSIPLPEPTSATVVPTVRIPKPTLEAAVSSDPPATVQDNFRIALQPEAESYEHLKPGQQYRVATTLTDFDGTVWREGFVFRYQTYNYFPYDEGLTLYHDQGSIRLCGLLGEQRDVMHQLHRFFVALA